MLRNLSAVVLFALAGAAFACDDAGIGKSATYAPDDGIPEKAVAAPAKPTVKDVATPVATDVAKTKQPTAPKKRAPQGKPLA